jgi:WD40 repeat protein
VNGSDLFLFVSHVSEDRAAADEIVAELERRGIHCWIAPRDVRPGRPFDDEIAAAIDASRAMLLIFSERCNDSEYIRREVTVAGESQKIIIPFRIEDAQPRRGLRVRLSDLHWIDGFASRERAIDELTEKLSASGLNDNDGALRKEARRRPAADLDHRGTTHGLHRFGLSPPLIVGCILALVLAAALFAIKPVGLMEMLPGQPAAPPSSSAAVSQPPMSSESRPAAVLNGHTDTVQAVAFAPDGKVLASGSDDRTIKLWEVPSGRILRSLTGHTGSVGSVAFSPDGGKLVTASDDKTIKLWDVATGQAIATLTEHTDYVTAVAFSPDGRLLVSASDDKTVILWEVATGRRLRTLEHPDRVGSVAFSPTGEIIALAGDDKAIRLWKATTGELVRTLTGHTDRINEVRFSPDGGLLASASEDTTVKLWNWTDGQILRTLADHKEPVGAIAFSPSGQLLATASHDHTIKLWGPSAGALLETLTDDVETGALAFSPDGRTLASGNDGHTIKLWDVSKVGR